MKNGSVSIVIIEVRSDSVGGALVGKELGSVSVVPSVIGALVRGTDVRSLSVGGALVKNGSVSVVIIEVGSDSVGCALVITDVRASSVVDAFVASVTDVTDVGSLSVDGASEIVIGGVVEVIFGTAA